MYKHLQAFLLIFSLFSTPLTSLALENNSATNNELSELAALLPESEMMVVADAEQFIKKTVPTLLNNNVEKLQKLTTLVKTIEENTGVNVLDVNQIAISYNFTVPKKRSAIPNFDFTAIIKTNIDNSDLVENWVKKYDAIFSFEKERAESKSYIESFKVFNKSDYSKSIIESRQEFLVKINANLKQAREIETRLNKLPKSETTEEIIKENDQIIERLEKLAEIFQTDIKIGDLPEKATDLINRWNKITISDKDRVSKNNQILKEAKEIYPVYAKKYDSAEKSERIISIIDIFDHAEVSFETRSFFDKTNANLGKIVTSFKTLPQSAASRRNSLYNIRKDIKLANDEINSVFETGMYALIKDTPFDKPTENEFQKTKISSFAQEFQKHAKFETVNSKKFISIDLKSFFETVAESNEEKLKTDEVAAENREEKVKTVKIGEENKEHKIEKSEPEKLGIGFLDNNTLAIGSSETVLEILNRDPSAKNTRALELLNFTKNPLVAFAVDSKVIAKNSPKKEKDSKEETAKTEDETKEDKAKEPEVKTGESKIGSEETKTDESKTEEKKETPDDDDDFSFSPFGGIFDFLKNSDIYGSLNFDPNSSEYNDISLSIGLLWNKEEEEPEEPLIADGKGDDAEITGTSLEVAGFQIGKELGYDLLKTFKGLQATLIFKFEKEKVANLVLTAPEIINGEYQAKTKVNKSKPKALRLNNLSNLLTNPEFYSDLIKATKKKKI